MTRAITAALLLAACATTTFPSTLRINLRSAPDARECMSDGTVIVKIGNAEARRLPTSQNEYIVSVPSDGKGTVVLERNGCWSPEREWTADEQTVTELPVYHAATATGSFLGTKTVPSLVVNAFLSRGKKPPATMPVGDVLPCIMQGRDWSCHVPAGVPFDLRLEPRGYAAIYYWDAAARPSETVAMPPAELVVGSSISGWVQLPNGKPAANAIVALRPMDAPLADSHTAARRLQTLTTKRGFFQIAGVAQGDYLVAARSTGYSEATLPVHVAQNESVMLARPLRHAPLASLSLQLDPEADPAGAPWRVQLTDAQTDIAGGRPIATATVRGGRWTVKALQAARYNLVVANTGGSVFARIPVDLTAGDAVTLPISITGMSVRGRVMRGEHPLHAGLRFSNSSGHVVTAAADEDGQFEAIFPAAGSWTPVVTYPPGRRLARITVDPITVAPNADLIISLPGGRVTGTVVTTEGVPVTAAVRVLRNGRVISQQATDDAAKFDLIGLRNGVYSIEAEAGDASTAQPVLLEITSDSDTDVTLVVQSQRVIRGVIQTPGGAPASGAAVRISRDAGRTWFQTTADIDGSFHTRVPAAADVVIAVSSYSYPSTLVRLPQDVNEATIQLPAAGGVLRVLNDSSPFLLMSGVFVPPNMFWFPEPFGRFNGGVFLPPGTYTACPQPQLSAACRRADIEANDEIVIDFRTTEHPNQLNGKSD